MRDLDWHSLGRAGLTLHVQHGGRVLAITVLSAASRGKRWVVAFDGAERARFSLIEEAVESVDYEIARLDAVTLASAAPDAAWRHQPASAALRALLPRPVDRPLRVIDGWRMLAHARTYGR